MSLLQNEDFKTEAQITGAGGNKNQLLNDTKIYVTANSINKTLDDAIIDGDIGGGGGGGGNILNFIDNDDFETDTSGWTTYDDANSVPVDGTGGTVSCTLTRTTSSPLRGTGSGLFSKPASNVQGEGAAYAFTIDAADKGNLLEINFDYNTTANYVNGYLQVYVYDVTNSTLITPLLRHVQANTSFGRGRAFFKASSTSVSYRLLFHIDTSTSTDWDFKFDRVLVFPSEFAGCYYETNSGQSFANGSYTTFEDKVYDTHDFSSGGLTFTIPVTGFYEIKLRGQVGAVSATVVQQVSYYLEKNGSIAAPGLPALAQYQYQTTTSHQGILVGSAMMHLLKGDVLKFYQSDNVTPATSLTTNPDQNYITITKVS